MNPVQFYPLVPVGVHLLSSGCSAGPLAWLMLQYVTGGAWGVVIRRRARPRRAHCPLVAVMFCPIVIGMPNLYEWTRRVREVAADSEHKRRTSTCRSSSAALALYLGGWMLLRSC